MQNANQEEFRIEKLIKRKDDALYVKWKGYDNSFNSWIDKKDLVWFYRMQFPLYKMSQYLPKPYKPFGGDINVKVDLSNYATKADIKNISHVDTSSFALKTNLANLKTEVDKLDIDKLKPLPDDVSKLSNVVTNEVVKKTDYNTKITEIENKIPDTSNLATKTLLTTVENKISGIGNLVKKTDYNAKITDLGNKIPDFSHLGTKTALISVENKIPDISNLVKKQIITIKLQKLKISLIIRIMINILILKSLIN